MYNFDTYMSIFFVFQTNSHEFLYKDNDKSILLYTNLSYHLMLEVQPECQGTDNGGKS